MSKTTYDNYDEYVIDSEKDKIVERFECNIRKSASHLGEWRVEAQASFDEYAGNQWEETDLEILKKQKRPPVVFNLTMRLINYVCGLEVQNRQEVKLFPRRIDGNGLADLGNDAFKWVRDNCDAEDEDSETFRDAVICGLGFSEIRMDYEESPEGDIKITRLDPCEIYYDPSSRKKNLVDRRWICHKTYMTIDEIEHRWGEDIVADYNAITLDESDANPHNNVAGDQYQSGNKNTEKDVKGKIAVYHYQEYTVVCMYRTVNPMTGQVEDIAEEDYKKLEESGILQNVRYVKIPKRKYMQHFFVGRQLVESQELPFGMFTLNAITGYYDRNKNVYFGLCRVVRDPQMWKNKLFSQIIHMFNTNAKGGLIVEEGVIPDITKFTDEWARADSVVEISPGGLERMQQKVPPAYPQGLDRLMEHAEKSMTEVSGISEESLGMAGREQPYVLEHLRQKQGTIQHAQLFDSNRRYRKLQGRLMYKYIQNYISDGRLVRVLGPEGARYIPLFRDSMSQEYDVVVADAPTSPNEKNRTFEVLMQMIPLALQSGIAIPPEVLDYAPLPESLTTKWKQRIMTPDPTAQQLQQLKLAMGQLEAQQTQLENQKLSAEVGKTMSEIPLNQAKAQQAAAIGQDESAQAMQKMGIAHGEMQLKAKEMNMKQAMDYVDMLMTQKRKQEEMKLNAQIKMQQSRQPSQLIN